MKQMNFCWYGVYENSNFQQEISKWKFVLITKKTINIGFIYSLINWRYNKNECLILNAFPHVFIPGIRSSIFVLLHISMILLISFPVVLRHLICFRKSELLIKISLVSFLNSIIFHTNSLNTFCFLFQSRIEFCLYFPCHILFVNKKYKTISKSLILYLRIPGRSASGVQLPTSIVHSQSFAQHTTCDASFGHCTCITRGHVCLPTKSKCIRQSRNFSLSADNSPSAWWIEGNFKLCDKQAVTYSSFELT